MLENVQVPTGAVPVKPVVSTRKVLASNPLTVPQSMMFQSYAALVSQPTGLPLM